MMTFLLIVSMLLHGISIFAIILLYMRQNRYRETERRAEKLQRELDESMHAYLVAFKEQNEEISSLLSSAQKKSTGVPLQPPDPARQIAGARKSFAGPAAADIHLREPADGGGKKPYTPPFMKVRDKLELTAAKDRQDLGKAGNSEAGLGREDKEDRALLKGMEHEYAPEKPSARRKQRAMMPWEERAVEMNRNNYRIEEIAKELQKGKTEIELLLKFHG